MVSASERREGFVRGWLRGRQEADALIGRT